MFNYISQRREAAIVIEAAFLMRPETLQRRRSVSSIRRTIRLKIINADFSRVVHVPTRLREQRSDVTVLAFRITVEYQFPILDGGRSRRRCRGWNGQLIKMESRKLRRDQIRLTSNVSEAGASRHRELCRVLESRVIESAFAVHFEIRDESVPMCHGTPTRPGVKVHAGQAECGRDQRRGRLSIIAKGFAIEEKFGVKLSRSPAAEDASNRRLIDT